LPVIPRRIRPCLIAPRVVLAAFAALAVPSLASAATGSITGTVSEAGTGVDNLTVVAYRPTSQPLDGDLGASQAMAETSGGGVYTLTGLSAGTNYIVLALPGRGTPPASTDGYVATYSNGATTDAGAATVTATAAGTTANVALVQGATISGTITDPSGAGVGNVEVSLSDAGDSQIEEPLSDGGGNIDNHSFYAETAGGGTAGSYTFTGVPPGTYYLDVSAEDDGGTNYADVWYGGSATEAGATPVSATPGGTITANQALSNAGEITGTVDDGVNGGPFTSQGEVYLYDAAGEQLQDGNEQINATNGTYSFDQLLPGTYYLEFAPGNNTGPVTDFATGWYNGTSLAESQATGTGITVASGATVTPSTISAITGGSISGTVTAFGNPASNVEVELYDSQNQLMSTGTSTSTDGTYTLGNQGGYYVPGTYKVEFYSQGANLGFQYYNNATTLAAAASVTVSGGVTTPNINGALSAGGTITGTVTAASSGAGAPDISVFLEDAQGNQLGEAETNPDGTYTLPAIPTGTYYLEFESFAEESGSTTYQVQYYGGKQVLAGSTTVSVTGGSTTSGINAALSVASTPGQTTTTTTTKTTTVDVAPTLTATVPTVSGTAKVGDALTANLSGWTAGTTYGYQWYAGGKAITGATSSTYALTGADYKDAITVAVTGKLSGYTWVTETSVATAAVAEGTLKTVVPKITGTATVGKAVAAKTGSWTSGTKFTYQWYANKKAIKGATKSKLKLAKADKGKTITLKVTGKLTGYGSAAKTSKATNKVAG
jgi:5-hydroxyisourate hydrolase-like protein (transthyretin family)